MRHTFNQSPERILAEPTSQSPPAAPPSCDPTAPPPSPPLNGPVSPPLAPHFAPTFAPTFAPHFSRHASNKLSNEPSNLAARKKPALGALMLAFPPVFFSTFAPFAVVAVTAFTLILSGQNALAAETDTNVITVTPKNLRNAKGVWGCALYRGENGFPSDRTKAVATTRISLSAGNSSSPVCVFKNVVPANDYAVSAMHDENDNMKLDANFFGIPTEGYAMSNDAPPGPVTPPNYKDARFAYNGGALNLTLLVRY